MNLPRPLTLLVFAILSLCIDPRLAGADPLPNEVGALGALDLTLGPA